MIYQMEQFAIMQHTMYTRTTSSSHQPPEITVLLLWTMVSLI